MNEIPGSFSLSSWERFLYSIIAQGRDLNINLDDTDLDDLDLDLDIEGPSAASLAPICPWLD